MTAVAVEAPEQPRSRSWPRFDLDRAMPYLLALGIVVIQQVFFGVPLGIFVRGVLIGLLTALIALGMALTYRSNRFINFAQADMGTIPVVLIVMLMTAWGWPYLVAVPVGVLAALAVGAIVELGVIRRFFKAPRLLITVASLGLSQLLTATAILLPRLWGVDFPLLGQRLAAPFHLEFSIGTVVFDANDLIAMIVAPLALVGLAVFLRMSSVGVAIRASADSADRASLLGVPVKRLQTLVWSVASLLAFTAIFLRAGILGLPVFGALTVGVLLRALAALVLGRMTNLLAIGANAVALGILEVSIGFAASSPLLIDPILALIIILALVLTRRGSTRVDEADSSTWRSADDVRPIPDEVAHIPVVQLVKWATFAVIGAAVLVLPQILSVDRTYKLSVVGIYAVLGLSVVVLTGWAGQVSLGQIAFFAIGATVGAKATLDWHLDLSIAFVISFVVGGVVAALVGLPALRRRGFYLAVATLAFSLATTSYFLNKRYFGWVPDGRIPRPPLFGRIDITSTASFYYVVYAVLVLSLFVVKGIRDSRTGRAFMALRDNERAAEAYGLHATRVRLVVFGLSGALAGLAGCLWAHQIQGLDPDPLAPFQNLLILTYVIIGGVTTPLGAIIGAAYWIGLGNLLPVRWQILASGVGVLVVLLVLPSGIGGLFYRLRDRWLARVAHQHDVVAPGLASTGPETPLGSSESPVPEPEPIPTVAVD